MTKKNKTKTTEWCDNCWGRRSAPPRATKRRYVALPFLICGEVGSPHSRRAYRFSLQPTSPTRSRSRSRRRRGGPTNTCRSSITVHREHPPPIPVAADWPTVHETTIASMLSKHCLCKLCHALIVVLVQPLTTFFFRSA
jgi:hypothetical protein